MKITLFYCFSFLFSEESCSLQGHAWFPRSAAKNFFFFLSVAGLDFWKEIIRKNSCLTWEASKFHPPLYCIAQGWEEKPSYFWRPEVIQSFTVVRSSEKGELGKEQVSLLGKYDEHWSVLFILFLYSPDWHLSPSHVWKRRRFVSGEISFS